MLFAMMYELVKIKYSKHQNNKIPYNRFKFLEKKDTYLVKKLV